MGSRSLGICASLTGAWLKADLHQPTKAESRRRRNRMTLNPRQLLGRDLGGLGYRAGGLQRADQVNALAEVTLICSSQFPADQFRLNLFDHFAVRRPRAGRGVGPGRGSSFPDHSDISSGVSPYLYCPLPDACRIGARISLSLTVTGISRGICEPVHTSRKSLFNILSDVGAVAEISIDLPP